MSIERQARKYSATASEASASSRKPRVCRDYSPGVTRRSRQLAEGEDHSGNRVRHFLFGFSELWWAPPSCMWTIGPLVIRSIEAESRRRQLRLVVELVALVGPGSLLAVARARGQSTRFEYGLLNDSRSRGGCEMTKSRDLFGPGTAPQGNPARFPHPTLFPLRFPADSRALTSMGADGQDERGVATYTTSASKVTRVGFGDCGPLI